MKTVAMILTSLFVWSSAQAAEELPIKKLQCGQPAFESAYIELNPNGYDPSYNIVRGQPFVALCLVYSRLFVGCQFMEKSA